MRKERRYGGAERAWEVRAELPILWRWVDGLVYARYRVKGEEGGCCWEIYTYSFIIVGRKTGRELNATLQQRSMPAVK